MDHKKKWRVERDNGNPSIMADPGERMGVAVRPVVVNGLPARDSIAASKDYHVIVMGTSGRLWFGYLRPGSVAKKTVRHAGAPCLPCGHPHLPMPGCYTSL